MHQLFSLAQGQAGSVEAKFFTIVSSEAEAVYVRRTARILCMIKIVDIVNILLTLALASANKSLYFFQNYHQSRTARHPSLYTQPNLYSEKTNVYQKQNTRYTSIFYKRNHNHPFTPDTTNMAVFLPLNATRRKRNLGESGTCMSNPNLMVGLDETYTYSERLSNQNAVNKMATPGYKHRIPETVESVLTIIKQKLKERHAEGPAGFLKIFRDIDVDHGGTIDRDELRRFLDYYHLGTNEEVFEKVFVSLDPDQSGDIDMSEFLEHLLDRTDVTSDNAEQGLLHSRQQGGSREFESSSPKPKECKPITNMTAEEVLQLVRQKVENRSSIINGVTQTSFRFFKRGIGLNTSITKDHFFAVLKQFNILLSDTLEQEVWDIFDEDQDGELSFEEFIDHFIAK